MCQSVMMYDFKQICRYEVNDRFKKAGTKGLLGFVKTTVKGNMNLLVKDLFADMFLFVCVLNIALMQFH